MMGLKNLSKKQAVLLTGLGFLLCIFFVNIYYICQIRKAKKLLRTTQQKIQQTLRSHPGPIDQRLESSQKKLETLNFKLADLTKKFITQQTQFFPNTQQTALDFTLNLQEFIRQQQVIAKEKSIKIPENCAFSFSDCLSRIPDQTQLQPLIQQYFIVRFLLDLLFNATPPPHTLLSVQRQPISPLENTPDTFALSPSASLGAIFHKLSTTAFSIQFASGTRTLRAFLNGIASAPIPLIVRELSAKPHADQTPVQQFKVVLEFVDIHSVEEAAAAKNAQKTVPAALSQVVTIPWKSPPKNARELFESSREAQAKQKPLPFVLKGISQKPYKLQFKGSLELPNKQQAVLVSSASSKDIYTLLLNQRDPALNVTLTAFSATPQPQATVLDHAENASFVLADKPVFYENHFLLAFEPTASPLETFTIDGSEKKFRFQNTYFYILNFDPKQQTITIKAIDSNIPQIYHLTRKG